MNVLNFSYNYRRFGLSSIFGPRPGNGLLRCLMILISYLVYIGTIGILGGVCGLFMLELYVNGFFEKDNVSGIQKDGKRKKRFGDWIDKSVFLVAE